jgi:uncharacterized protein (DUF2267 family)
MPIDTSAWRKHPLQATRSRPPPRDDVAGGPTGPDQLRPYLIKLTEPAVPFSYDEFMRRVAEHAGVDRPTAERGVAAMLSALHEMVGHKEFTDATVQLPREFGQLVATASAGR